MPPLIRCTAVSVIKKNIKNTEFFSICRNDGVILGVRNKIKKLPNRIHKNTFASVFRLCSTERELHLQQFFGLQYTKNAFAVGGSARTSLYRASLQCSHRPSLIEGGALCGEGKVSRKGKARKRGQKERKKWKGYIPWNIKFLVMSLPQHDPQWYVVPPVYTLTKSMCINFLMALCAETHTDRRINIICFYVHCTLRESVNSGLPFSCVTNGTKTPHLPCSWT